MDSRTSGASLLSAVTVEGGNVAAEGVGDRSAEEICAWLVSYLADLLEVEPDEIDVVIPFDRYGLDSSAAIGMTGDLEDWLGKSIDPTVLYDYPTIQGLAQHLGSNS